jgi:hypothetical protein
MSSIELLMPEAKACCYGFQFRCKGKNCIGY